MAEPIEFEITADTEGIAEALKVLAQRLKELEDAAESVGDALPNTSKGADGARKAAGEAAKATGEYRQTIGQLAQGLGVLNPKIGQAAGSIMGFSAALGPAGIAAGVLTTAVGFLAAEMAEQQKAAEELRATLDSLTATWIELANAADMATGTTSRDVQQILETQLTLKNQISAQIEALGGEVAANLSVEGIRLLRLYREVRHEIFLTTADLNQAARAELAKETQQKRSTFAAQTRSRGGGGGQSRLQREAEENTRAMEAALREQERMEAASARERQRITEERYQFEADERARALEDEERYHDLRREMAAQELEVRRNVEETIARVRQKNAETEQRLADEREDTIKGLVGVAGQAGQQLLDQFGATEGQKELWAGAIEVAEAIGAYPDVVGIAAHGLSAALHFANAAQMGVGGGGSQTPAIPSGTPRPETGGGGAGGGGGTIVVNYNVPVSEAEMGRRTRRSLDMADRRFGRRVT